MNCYKDAAFTKRLSADQKVLDSTQIKLIKFINSDFVFQCFFPRNFHKINAVIICSLERKSVFYVIYTVKNEQHCFIKDKSLSIVRFFLSLIKYMLQVFDIQYLKKCQHYLRFLKCLKTCIVIEIWTSDRA